MKKIIFINITVLTLLFAAAGCRQAVSEDNIMKNTTWISADSSGKISTFAFVSAASVGYTETGGINKLGTYTVTGNRVTITLAGEVSVNVTVNGSNFSYLGKMFIKIA